MGAVNAETNAGTHTMTRAMRAEQTLRVLRPINELHVGCRNPLAWRSCHVTRRLLELMHNRRRTHWCSPGFTAARMGLSGAPLGPLAPWCNQSRHRQLEQ